MALETLEKVRNIGGFQVTRGIGYFSKSCPVFVHEESNQLSFQIQRGAIKEVGVNGCQIDTIIETAKLILEGLNTNYLCRENSMAITKLDEALMWLDKRKKDREKRNVEGTSNV